MNKIKDIVITRDSFIDVLGLAKVRSRLTDNSKIDGLYQCILEFFQSEEAIIGTVDTKENTNELQFRVHGTPICIGLSGLLKKKLENFVTLYLIFNGMNKDNIAEISAGILLGLYESVSVLRKEYGELCIFESFGEIESKTANNIFTNLYGKKCRYSRAKCQFFSRKNSICLFDRDNIKGTLEELEKKELIKKKNNVEPIEWSIVF